MNRVLKQPLAITDWQSHSWPKGSLVLHVADQNGQPTIWFLAPAGEENEFKKEFRRFRIAGTGHQIDEPGLQYLGTTHGGNGLIWHVFEDKRPREEEVEVQSSTAKEPVAVG